MIFPGMISFYIELTMQEAFSVLSVDSAGIVAACGNQQSMAAVAISRAIGPPTAASGGS